MNSDPTQQTSRGTYYAQVDTHRATKDYLRKGSCVRFIAVEPQEFSDAALADGVKTFTIDIDLWAFCTAVFSLGSWRQVHSKQVHEIQARDDDAKLMSQWYCIEVDFATHDAGYLYETFSNLTPKRFGLISLRPINSGPVVPATPSRHPAMPSSLQSGRILVAGIPGAGQAPAGVGLGSSFCFESFHVGQGMCSLVHNGQAGVLIDAGAGKPVTRPAYIEGKLKNDLKSQVVGLRTLCAVVSHADSDHWRMLAWDSDLRERLTHLFVPVGAKSLALHDKALNKKVHGIADETWSLDATSELRLLRSTPTTSDSNGECLVAVFERQTEQVLAAGDYVYSRFAGDKNAGIVALAKGSYAAVVVPHHGDAASAHSIPTAKPRSRAFFSAGTHQGYGHPTPVSLTNHDSAGYVVIEDRQQANIVRVRLL